MALQLQLQEAEGVRQFARLGGQDEVRGEDYLAAVSHFKEILEFTKKDVESATQSDEAANGKLLDGSQLRR